MGLAGELTGDSEVKPLQVCFDILQSLPCRKSKQPITWTQSVKFKRKGVHAAGNVALTVLPPLFFHCPPKLKSQLVVIRPQIPQGRQVVHIGTGL